MRLEVCTECGALVVERWQRITGTEAMCTVPLHWAEQAGEIQVCANGHRWTVALLTWATT